MAAGKPILCIAPHNIAVFEYLENVGNSYLVDSFQDIEKGLVEIYTDDRYEIKAQQSKVHYEQDLSWNSVSRRFLECINRSCRE